MRTLDRPRSYKIFLGICGGLAQYLEIDSTFIRFLAVILLIFTGFLPLIAVYLVAALIIPVEPNGAPRTEYRHLFRSKSNRKIAGICGGLGILLNVDPTTIRLVAVFLCLLTGVLPLVVIYLIGWMIIPEK